MKTNLSPNPKKKHQHYCLFIYLLVGAYSALGLNINGFTNSNNDRFTNHPSFIATEYDLSGVGRDYLFPGRRSWATLISPNVIISVNHFKPRGGVRFFYGNDRSEGFIDMAIVGAKARIPNTDIYLAQLAENVPDGIQVYDFVKTPLSESSFGASGLAGDLMFMTGIHPTKEGNLLDMVVGTNRIDGFADNFSNSLGSELDYIIAEANSPSDTGFTSSEPIAQVGDSGAPAFVIENDELKLLGLNSALLGGSTLIQYLGNERVFIEEFILEASNEPLDDTLPPIIPEPSLGALTFLLGAKIWLSRTRRSKRKNRRYAPFCFFPCGLRS